MRWLVLLDTSGGQRVDEIDVFLHGTFLAGAFQFRPGMVFRRGGEIEQTGSRAADIAFRALLVQAIQTQHGVVVRAFRQAFHVLRSLFELFFNSSDKATLCCKVLI